MRTLSIAITMMLLLTAISLADEAAVTVQAAEGPSLPLAVGGNAGGIVDGLPVVAGGSSWSADRKTKSWHDECFVYRDGKWTPGPSLPVKLADPAYAWSDRGLYLAGGVSGKTPIRDAYHLASVRPDAKWTPLPSLPEPLDGGAGAIIGDTFYVAGGFNETEASNRLWKLNLNETGAQWQACAAIPAAGRAFAALVACGQHLYLFGGYSSPPYQTKDEVFADVHRYHPGSNRWEKLDLDLPGYAWTATAVDDHTIMLTGHAPEIGKISDEILLVDLNTLKVSSAGKLVFQSCCMPAIPTAEPNTWMLPGGEPDTNRTRTNRTSLVTLTQRE